MRLQVHIRYDVQLVKFSLPLTDGRIPRLILNTDTYKELVKSIASKMWALPPLFKNKNNNKKCKLVYF